MLNRLLCVTSKLLWYWESYAFLLFGLVRLMDGIWMNNLIFMRNFNWLWHILCHIMCLRAIDMFRQTRLLNSFYDLRDFSLQLFGLWNILFDHLSFLIFYFVLSCFCFHLLVDFSLFDLNVLLFRIKIEFLVPVVFIGEHCYQAFLRNDSLFQKKFSHSNKDSKLCQKLWMSLLKDKWQVQYSHVALVKLSF